jgi:hypothetical protein
MVVHALIKNELWVGDLNVGTSRLTQNIHFINVIRRLMGEREYPNPQVKIIGMSANLDKLKAHLPKILLKDVKVGLYECLQSYQWADK